MPSPDHSSPCRILLSLMITATLATGCGGAAPILTQDGNAWECGQALRKTPKADLLLGWVSISSVDRWIAAVDRIGQRAGQFAPGSSVRETALASAEERLAAMGVKNIRWLDLMRPIHALVQADATSPVFGLSLVVPVTDQDKAVSATAKLRTDFKAKGHDLVLDLQKANSKGTGRKPLWVHWLDHGTALATLHPDRISGAKALGKCVETRQPRELLHVGVAVADMLKRHRREFSFFQRKLLSMAKKTGSGNEMLGLWTQRIERLLTQTDAAMLLASAGKDDVSLGLSLNAKAKSDLAQVWTHHAALAPNSLAAHLPAEAYLAMTQTYDAMASKREFESMMRFYTAAMNVPEAEVAGFRADVRSLTQLSGVHSGVALYRDGRLPLGMYGIFDSKAPAKMMKILSRVAMTSVRVAMKQMRTKMPGNAKTSQLLDVAEQTVDLGWGGMIDQLVTKSQKWPVRFEHHKQAPAGLACQALRLTPDMNVFAKANKLRMLSAFMPRKLDLAVCTSSKFIHFAMGPNALSHIKAGEKGPAQSLASTRWFQEANKINGKPAQTVMALNPGPLVKLAAAFVPKLPDWPKDTAISTACLYSSQTMRCDLRMPVVIADYVAALRGPR